VRRGLAQVPERRQLFGTMSVEENLRMGAYASPGGVAARLDEQFTMFPILGERRRQPAQTLSGGEQQMLAIARASMSRPRLLLLDEPSLGLAPLLVERVMAEIRRLRAAGGTVLIVEQNARAALVASDRGYVIENGRVTRSGDAASLLADPAVQDAYLGGEGGSTRGMEARIRQRRASILGR
jgi:branched-chain amino acid transport system ATP-binding protein